MKTQVPANTEKTSEFQRSITPSRSEGEESISQTGQQLDDRRTSTAALKTTQAMMNNSPQVKQLKSMQAIANKNQPHFSPFTSLADNAPPSKEKSLQAKLDGDAAVTSNQGSVVQCMMSRAAFITSTTNGEARKSIATIDTAIQNYETLLNAAPAPSAAAKRDSLRLVLTAVDNYIQAKEQGDPTNTRIAPVKRLKQDVEFTIAGYEGDLPTAQEVTTAITDEPDQVGTRNWVTAVSHAPSMVPEVKRFIAATTAAQKAATLRRLQQLDTLQYILDAAFVDGEGIIALRALPEGDALSADDVKILNACMATTVTLAVAKEILARRFHIPLGNVDALEANQPNEDGGLLTPADVIDWTLPGLKHAYNAMTVLPKGHAADNASLQHVRRYTGGGGWHGGDRMAIGYRGDEERVSADPRTFTDKIKSRGHHAFTGKNMIDQTVRHEVGHAVDAKANLSTARCINNANGGNWQTFASPLDMVIDYLNRTGSAMATHGAMNGGVRYTISTLLDDGANVETIKTDVIRLMTQYSGQLAIPFDPAIVRNDPVFKVMTRANLTLPWKSAAPGHAGNRTYVYSNAQTMSSYDAGARARQVSNYQFRAPKEWFAEAYAAFYEPDNSALGHGSALQSADPNTYNYFVATVDRNL